MFVSPRHLLLLSILFHLSLPAIAQTSRPDSSPDDRFLQPTPEAAPLPEEPLSEPALPELDESEREVSVREVVVTGSTILSEEDWSELVAPLEGKTVTEREIARVANQISQIYIQEGFISSRAVPVTDGYARGLVEIRVVEGSIVALEIEGLERLNERYVRRRIERATTTPLNSPGLEDALRVLQSNPNIRSVAARLRKGEGLGQSILTVEIEEAPAFDLSLRTNNYSPIGVGGEQLETTVATNNLTGNSDRLAANVRLTSQDGSQTYEAIYSLPLNSLDGTLSARALINNNGVVSPDEVAELDIDGNFELYSIGFRQPLIRSIRKELALSLGFVYTEGQTFLLNEPISFGIGPDEDGLSAVSQLQFAQEYIERSASGSWLFRSQFNIGTQLFNATENANGVPDGQFLSWLFQGRRAQVLGQKNIAIFSIDSQLSTDPLLPVEQFSVGGGQSVRGYRQNLIAADNAIRLSFEDRITLIRSDGGRDILQLVPFIDGAVVWNDSNNPNELPFDRNTLIGLGAGIIWRPNPNIDVRFEYGQDLIEFTEVSSGNIQDDGLYFSVGWNLNPR